VNLPTALDSPNPVDHCHSFNSNDLHPLPNMGYRYLAHRIRLLCGTQHPRHQLLVSRVEPAGYAAPSSPFASIPGQLDVVEKSMRESLSAQLRRPLTEHRPMRRHDSRQAGNQVVQRGDKLLLGR
jgi:hypothetical protein